MNWQIGLVKRLDPQLKVAACNKSRSFECEIMDWADEVAYAVHDLEDSIHAGYVSASTFQDSDRIDDIVNRVTEKFKDCDVSVSEVWTELRNSLRKNNPDFQPFSNVSSLYEKKSNRKQLTSYLISRYIKATCRVKRDNVRNSRISERYMYTVSIPVEYKVEVALIIKLVMKFVIESPQVYTLEEKARHIVRCLFLKFMRDDNTKYLLPDDWKEHLRQVDSNEDKARVVSDYIAGMTDSYAQKTYARLFLPNQGSIYDLL